MRTTRIRPSIYQNSAKQVRTSDMRRYHNPNLRSLSIYPFSLESNNTEVLYECSHYNPGAFRMQRMRSKEVFK